MIRFLFRFSATLALAVAVIMAVLDATRSIAASDLVTTPLGANWESVAPDSLEQVQSFVVMQLDPLLWDPVFVAVLALPGFVVFGILALLLFAAGWQPGRSRSRFILER